MASYSLIKLELWNGNLFGKADLKDIDGLFLEGNLFKRNFGGWQRSKPELFLLGISPFDYGL